ncbi:MAG TPA: hypothetical protein VM242_06235 [Acidimicrobiales bacterium]|nr:hypothetical protein [Acidimicrobiales bacterium]
MRTPTPLSSTMTLPAGERRLATKRTTSFTPASAHPLPAPSRNSNHSFKLVA